MKLQLGSWSVVAGALLSFALVGCDAPPEVKSEVPAPGEVSGPKMKPAPTPETAKPAEPAVEAPKEATKPAEPTPAPKEESKKEEAPK